jgi:hypothetical protein
MGHHFPGEGRQEQLQVRVLSVSELLRLGTERMGIHPVYVRPDLWLGRFSSTLIEARCAVNTDCSTALTASSTSLKK